MWSARRSPNRTLALTALFVGCVAGVGPAHAYDSTSAEDVTIATPVTDLADVLSAADEERVAARLVAYREATGVQLAVLLVGSIDAPIDDWAHQVFQRWGGGSRERNDGALFVLAIADRANRLELGYGVEGHITDGMALDMLVALRPLLREGRYADAALQLIDAVWAATADITPAAPIGLPLSRSPWFMLGMMLVAFAGGARWVARIAAAVTEPQLAARGQPPFPAPETKRGAAAPDPAEVAAALALKRRRRLRNVIEVLALYAVAPALVMVLAHPGMRAPFPWLVAWESWVFIGVMGGTMWVSYPVRRWFWFVPGAAGFGALVYFLFAGLSLPAAQISLSVGGVVAGPGEVYTYGLLALVCAGFWTLTLMGATSTRGGGSSRGSSSSYRSSSSSSSGGSSSRSSSSSWSGGGGSSGGGGASSSW